MKKLLVIIFFSLAGALSAQAQDQYGPNKVECLKYLSYYEEYFKQKAYDDAMPNWRKAYALCPHQSRQTLLINGTTLYRRLIGKNAKNPEYKKALIDTLLLLHNERAAYFPKYKVSALNNKGQDIFNFVRGDIERQYKEYNIIIEINKSETKPTLFVHDFNAAVSLYQNKTISAEEVISVYDRNSSYLEGAPESSETQKAKSELESRFIASPVASCDNLIKIFTPKFDANPDDIKLVKSIVKVLNNVEGGINTDIFLKAVTQLNKLEPSYKSAYFLYRLYSSKNEPSNAVKYLEEAINDDASDNATDAGYNYELAVYSYKNGMSGKAFDAARKAAELDAATYAGKCYMLIASIWGSTSCGGDEISSRSQFWVAVDYLNKAKAADASLSEDVNAQIAKYAKYYPQTGDAFMYGLKDGESYSVNCGGMHAVTTVRTQK